MAERILRRVEDWARDKDPTEVTEEVGLCRLRGLWWRTEVSLLDLGKDQLGDHNVVFSFVQNTKNYSYLDEKHILSLQVLS